MNISTLFKATRCSAATLLLLAAFGCASSQRTMTPQDVAADVVLDDPARLERWIEYGRVCELSGNYAGAIEAYEYVLELDDTYVPAYEHLGGVYQEVGSFDKAQATYHEAMVAKQLHSPLLGLGCAYCLIEAREYDAALSLFQKLESKAEPGSPVHVSALLGRAAVLRSQGHNEQAEDAIAAAVEVDPDVLELLNGQSSAH